MLFDARRLSIHFDPQYLHAFDVAAAQEAGDLMASRHRKGRPGELRDTMIAGSCSPNMPRWQPAIRRTLTMSRLHLSILGWR